MKKILIATTALAAFTATSAFALDVKTSGAVEYKYSKKSEASVSTNPKLSQGSANVKFAASGASNGLAYGAWVNVKSTTSTTTGGKYTALTVDNTAPTADADKKKKINQKHGAKLTWTGTQSTQTGYDQAGNLVEVLSAGGDLDGYDTGSTSAKSTLSNNAVTQSAMWISGSFGKITVGQAGSAAGDNAIGGDVKAASFETGTTAASAGADKTEAERITYQAPTIVDGLTLAYTTSFKGNKSEKKTDKAKASSNWAIKYSTDLMGVAVSVAHASGTSGKTNDAKTFTDTQTGMTAGYGNFTVGYGVFSNAKRKHQKKGTEGSNMGVKYAMGDWAVGYTVKNSEDKNTYLLHSKKSAKTTAYSAKYQVASGFSVYASKSNNSVKMTDGKTTKNNYTLIGAKISF